MSYNDSILDTRCRMPDVRCRRESHSPEKKKISFLQKAKKGDVNFLLTGCLDILPKIKTKIVWRYRLVVNILVRSQVYLNRKEKDSKYQSAINKSRYKILVIFFALCVPRRNKISHLDKNVGFGELVFHSSLSVWKVQAGCPYFCNKSESLRHNYTNKNH